MSSNNALGACNGDASQPEVASGTDPELQQVLESELVENGWYLQPLGDVPVDLASFLQEISLPQTYRRSPGYAYDINKRNIPRRKQSLTLSPLCEFCKYVIAQFGPRILSSAIGVKLKDPRIQSISQFKNSASSGSCHLCRLRWNHLSLYEQEKIKEGWGDGGIWYGHSDMGDITLDFDYVVPVDEFRRWNDSSNIRLVRCEDIDIFPESFLSCLNNSNTSWALANSWLQCCESSHRGCQSTHPVARRLPTRLIDLGLRVDVVRPRLCYSADLPSDTTYTTLSHRWNEETEKCRLIMQLEKAWISALPISALPLRFKHAMESTKRLGMRYIWIDSICIIQDSVQDWQYESALMGDVYRNSSCNLLAASGGTGVFVKRNSMDVNLCVIQISEGLGEKTQQYFCMAGNSWNRNVEKNPLCKRSWVVQERVLSPRSLYFTQHQMFWECSELAACESLPAGMPYHYGTKLSVKTLSSEGSGHYSERSNVSSDSQYLWDRIVENYSLTESTYPDKDKLAAISGIAKSMEIESQYLAGIWRRYFVDRLCWTVSLPSHKLCNRPSKYQAPSWSWASVNAPILTPSVVPTRRQNVVTQLVEAYIERTSQDPTGPVRAGRIHMRGPLTPFPVPENGFSGLTLRFDSTSDQDRMDFHLLLIRLHSSDSGEPFAAEGLLLEPTRVTKGEFYRRGYCMYDPSLVTPPTTIPGLMELFGGSLERLSPENYMCVSEQIDPDCELPTYHITII